MIPVCRRNDDVELLASMKYGGLQRVTYGIIDGCDFNCCKNDNLQMKNCDVFLIFAQNMNCGHSLELSLNRFK